MSLLGVAGGFIEQNSSGEGYVRFLLRDNFVLILPSLSWSFSTRLEKVNSPNLFYFIFYLLGKFLQNQSSDVNNILKYSAHNFPRLYQPDNL